MTTDKQKFVDALTREVLMLTPEEARLRDVIPWEWSEEGMQLSQAEIVRKRTDALIDRMVRVLWHLTPQELHCLTVKHALTENMQVAASIRVEEASCWSHDNFDVPTFRGNHFYDWCDSHPYYGPEAPCPYCRWAPCKCCDEVPF